MTPTTSLEIDLGAIVENWQQLHAKGDESAGHSQVAAVLKADAYGTGATRVADALHQAGCRHVFTAHLEEAIPLARPGTMVAALNGLWPGTAPDYIEHGIRPVLGSLPEIAEWQHAARREGRPLPGPGPHRHRHEPPRPHAPRRRHAGRRPHAPRRQSPSTT